MGFGKGLGLSAVAALVAGAFWVLLIRASGWNLWILAPIVGGAAGYGMMRGTQMRGGAIAGLGAAAITVTVIFGSRYCVVSHEMRQMAAVSDEDAVAHLMTQVAADMERRGLETTDEEGDYTAAVQRKAQDTWASMSAFEREQYVVGAQEENTAAGVLTPLGLLVDFGVFGTIFAALAGGTAFKTGSMTLEHALVEKGLASEDEAAGVASRMRTEDTTKGASGQGQWRLPARAADDRPAPWMRPIEGSGGTEGRAADGREVA